MDIREFIECIDNRLKDDNELLNFWKDEIVPKITTEAKGDLTESAVKILKYLKDFGATPASAKMIGEGMGLSSRSISGSMRKLVQLGLVEKTGSNPVTYTITASGIEYNI